MTVEMQNSHWYQTDNGGWTAEPIYAKDGEVERVGLHDCEARGCEETHSGSAQEYYFHLLTAAEFARETEGDDRPKVLWANSEGPLHRRAVLRYSWDGSPTTKRKSRCVVR